ncbi:hypothetical protein LXL04_039758 [Taraxacum kok-saghyz]
MRVENSKFKGDTCGKFKISSIRKHPPLLISPRLSRPPYFKWRCDGNNITPLPTLQMAGLLGCRRGWFFLLVGHRRNHHLADDFFSSPSWCDNLQATTANYFDAYLCMRIDYHVSQINLKSTRNKYAGRMKIDCWVVGCSFGYGYQVRELAEKEDENGIFKLLRTDITRFLTTILIGTTELPPNSKIVATHTDSGPLKGLWKEAVALNELRQSDTSIEYATDFILGNFHVVIKEDDEKSLVAAVAQIIANLEMAKENHETGKSRTTAAAHQDLQAPKAGAEWSKTTPKDEQPPPSTQGRGRMVKNNPQGWAGAEWSKTAGPPSTQGRDRCLCAVYALYFWKNIFWFFFGCILRSRGSLVLFGIFM